MLLYGYISSVMAKSVWGKFIRWNIPIRKGRNLDRISWLHSFERWRASRLFAKSVTCGSNMNIFRRVSALGDKFS